MAAEITITADHVRTFRRHSGNPHLVQVGGHVRIYGEDYYRMYRPGRVIVTRADLDAIDPGSEDYTAEALADLLTTLAGDL